MFHNKYLISFICAFRCFTHYVFILTDHNLIIPEQQTEHAKETNNKCVMLRKLIYFGLTYFFNNSYPSVMIIVYSIYRNNISMNLLITEEVSFFFLLVL